jgi:hypothetical protein
MGMQQSVVFEGPAPSWQAICETLRTHQSAAPQMRMIDGQIALPDEQPPDDWQELRVTAGEDTGMITLRRDDHTRITLIVWANADQPLQRAWHHLTWACAATAAGTVEAEGARYSPDQFARACNLRP